MKKNIFICTITILSFLFCNQAFASGAALNTGEVNKLLTERTMTVTEVEPDKATGKRIVFKAYFTEIGAIRALYPDGSSENYNWSVSKNGSLCVVNNKRWARGVCGFIASDKNGTYKLYRNKRGNQKAKMKKDRVVITKEFKHFLTLSNPVDGNKLQ